MLTRTELSDRDSHEDRVEGLGLCILKRTELRDRDLGYSQGESSGASTSDTHKDSIYELGLGMLTIQS